MTIAIIGAGNVGLALGKALAASGEHVRYGLKDPDKYRAAIEAIPGATLSPVAEAVAGAEVVLLAVPYAAAGTLAESIPDWGGRVLVDVTNPLAPGLAGLAVGTTTSAAEETAARARNARVVKAFNTTGAENMLHPEFPGGRVFMPICGDDGEARARIVALAARIGFDAVDVGPLAAARYLEPFAMTWIHMAYKAGLGRDFAFGLLRR